MTGLQIALVVGGVTELLGLALASIDIWLDPARTSAARLRKRGRELASRFGRWLERMILRRKRVQVVSSGAAMPFETAGSVSAIKSIPDDAEHEEQLRLLRSLVVEIQGRLNTLDQQVDSLARNAARNTEALRDETRVMIAQAIRESERAYRGWRVLGFVLVLVGATIVWAASVW